MRAAARRIAEGLDRQASSRAAKRGRTTYRATVTRWVSRSEFSADLHGEDLSVDNEDVSLSKRVRLDHDDDPIVVGDVLVLVEVGEHDFIAIAVEDGDDDG